MNDIVIDSNSGKKIIITLKPSEITQDGTPTPEAPQDIHIITGSNNIKISDGTQEQNYPISLSSKNLFNDKLRQGVTTYNTGDWSDSRTRITSTNWITLPSGTYTINAISNNDKKLNISLVTFDINNNFYNIPNISGQWKSLPLTFTTDIPLKLKENIRYEDNVSNITVNEVKDIQLEEGSTATAYTPYYNLEHCKIGDYADQFFKNTTDSEFYDSTLLENEWYLKKNIGKVVWNGTEAWTRAWINTERELMRLYYRANINAATSVNRSYSDYLPTASSYADVENGATAKMCFLLEASNYNNVVIPTTTFVDVNTWKDWLSTHNTKVYYQLATPTYIHISETDYPILRNQLEDIYNNAHSYADKTYITQTNEDLPFVIEYELVKDLKNVLSNINEFLRKNL